MKSFGFLALHTSLAFSLSMQAHAQSQAPTASPSGQPSQDSLKNRDLIYLEADEVLDDQSLGVLTARGNVDAQYQNRSLSADEVIYNINSGRVFARGNVVLREANGQTQYADKIELSDQLQSGAATDYSARFQDGGLASAAYAVRRSDQGVELYNAFYTACEACEDEEGNLKSPTWRIKARRVTQDKTQQMIHYKDALFEFKGVPVFYMPYLAHPDPSSERRSGLLMPFAGSSGKYGAFYQQPYYWSISDYSDLTITPRISARVNPLIMATYNKRFYSGSLEVDGSFTHEDWFDSNGNPFTGDDVFLDPDEDLRGKEWRGHLFARGEFEFNDIWGWGFGYETVTDDRYLDRYDLDRFDDDFGLYDASSRRLNKQLYLVGQDDNFHYSASTYGFQSLRTTVTRSESNENDIIVSREDDDTLPMLLPKIEIDHYSNDPLLGGRIHAFGDAAILSRNLGDDYKRISAGVDWSKTYITPGGMEIKPFAQIRADHFNLNAGDQTVADREFSRTLGNAGFDARWTFIRPGEHVNLTLEPRVLMTSRFGESKIEQFSYIDSSLEAQSAFEDGLGLDLDRSILLSANKNAGYDLWQNGLRTDIGTSFSADWNNNRASLFLGRSFLTHSDDDDNVYSEGSGLSGDRSDIIGELDFTLFDKFNSSTRLRYDDDSSEIRRIDSSLSYTGERLSFGARYYKIDDMTGFYEELEAAPPEEVSGNVSYRFHDNWTLKYNGYRDIDTKVTRREELGLAYRDDCTLVELFYEKRRSIGLSGESEGLGVRIALLTLGEMGQ